MFDIIQVMGGSRNAILTIPPVYTRVVEGTDKVHVYTGAPSVMPIIIPKGCRVRKTNLSAVLANMLPTNTPLKTIYMRSNQPYILAETMVREIVHYWGRMTRGVFNYTLSYLWALPKALWDSIWDNKSWHQLHPTERLARDVAMKVLNKHFYDSRGNYILESEKKPLDALVEIQNLLVPSGGPAGQPS